jgi:hypothetical protein
LPGPGWRHPSRQRQKDLEKGTPISTTTYTIIFSSATFITTPDTLMREIRKIKNFSLASLDYFHMFDIV